MPQGTERRRTLFFPNGHAAIRRMEMISENQIPSTFVTLTLRKYMESGPTIIQVPAGKSGYGSGVW